MTPTTPEFARDINKDLNISVSRIDATLALLDAGATIPFIARYRKEATGNLDELRIREIADRYAFHKEFEDRRQFILAKLANKDQLTEELRNKIEAAQLRSDLEDLYLPYRPKRQSRANAARERGLAPLADFLQAQSGSRSAEDMASSYVSEDKDVPTSEAALAGALDIVAERVAEDPDLRKWLRDTMLHEGVLEAKAVKGAEAGKTKYSTYYDFTEAVARIPSHRFLAIRRGTREKVLSFSIRIDESKARSAIRDKLGIGNECQWAGMLERAAEDGFSRLLEPSIQAEVRSILRARAETEAIRVFEENLRALLLAPPAGQIPVLGVDPGLRSGSRIAAVDATGRFLEAHTTYLTEPKKDLQTARQTLLDVVRKCGARGIAIGNGTGSRETESFVRSTISEAGLDTFVVVVSEAGASVYSTSPLAREEFPDLDVSVRSAVFIARRLQDPLAELVKIDPKAIGVGQYQHDVNQNRLKASLASTVESSVNRVGVDLNTASADLLRHIAGLEESLAHAIVEHRDKTGAFSNRRELLGVAGLGEKAFEQAAGFLRIENGSSALDKSSVHPESYAAVERMAASVGIGVDDLIANPSRIQSITFADFEEEFGHFTVADIRAELEKPGRDPRKTFALPRFRDDVREVTDLKEGMELEGQVTNVTNFGAFVDVGVHQDGLIHISELSHRYVADARRAIGVGDLVKVKVISVDPKVKRISLSRKAMLPAPPPRPRPGQHPQPKPGPKPGRGPASDKSQPNDRRRNSKIASRSKPRKTERSSRAKPQPVLSMEEQIRRLQEKFRGPGKK